MRIEHALNLAGHQIVEMSDKPDLCIINTCAVTAKADYQSRQLINRAIKKTSDVIVTGCYAELNHEQIKKRYCDIRIVRNVEKDNIINMLKQKKSSNLEVKFNLDTVPFHRPDIISRHRPIIKVQDGCNYSCSYCTIPMARGKSRSFPVENVLNEIRMYESLGFKEVVLTGIHLGTYGYDLKPKIRLTFLLKEILKNTNIPRIRLSSLEIKEIDEELIELLSEARLCSHLHIPLQSGDDNILKLMNRMYSVDDFYKGIEKIISLVPGISIGTDIIVGFPGEGEPEFNNTVSLIESLPFAYTHVFPFSPRPGTRAVSLPGHVSDYIKKERLQILRQIGLKKKSLFIKNQIGNTVSVILEERIKGYFLGTTDNFIKIHIKEQIGLKEGMLLNCVISGNKNGIVEGLLDNSLQVLNS